MQTKVRYLAAMVVGAVATLASASSIACTFESANPVRIKQMMADEIAYRLGMRPDQVPLIAITEPRLITPYELDANCSGLGAYHFTAGFRVLQPVRQRPGPSPDSGSHPDPGPDTAPGPWLGVGPRPRPGNSVCVYEGVAVVLGYSYASPVAVNFEHRCR